MTREEAIKELEFAKLTDDYMLHEAADMAIKALRQEDILDRIRTEMEEHAFLVSHSTYTIGLPLFSILKIIDKYKMKSEDKNDK